MDKPPPMPEASTGTAGLEEGLLRRLEWTVIRRLDGLLQGDYRTLFRGVGVDLIDLREYQLHDDVRHIDWNVTARLQVPHVRVYTEDRELTAWFLLDLSASVGFGSQERTKQGVSAQFVAVLARLLTRRGNSVGALLYGSQVDTVLPPRGGRSQVLQLLRRMRTRPLVKGPTHTDLGTLLHAAGRIARRRSLIFVVSDFISRPGWEDALAQLARRHEVIAVRLVDPLERELPAMGLAMFQDAESGEQIFVDTLDPKLRARFAALAQQRDAELLAVLRHADVPAIELATDDDLLDALLRFAELRRRQRRPAAGGSLPSHLRPAEVAAPGSAS
jgi:uncharacterized protein (DUF58 family)